MTGKLLTQTLRQNLLQNLQQKILSIVYFEQFLHPGGGNRLKEFKPLYEWINNHYEITEQREAAQDYLPQKTIIAVNQALGSVTRCP